MHKKHMFFYIGITLIILIVASKIVQLQAGSRIGLALGVGQGSDPRLPDSANNKNPLYTPLIRRLQGVTAF